MHLKPDAKSANAWSSGTGWSLEMQDGPESVGCKRLDPPLRVSSPFSATLVVGCRTYATSRSRFLQSLDNSFLRLDRATSSGGRAVRNKTRESTSTGHCALGRRQDPVTACIEVPAIARWHQCLGPASVTSFSLS